MAIPGRRVRISWGFNPASGEPAYDNWSDVTDCVRSIKIRAGRLLDLERVEASTCTIELLNTDGRFTPENTSGAYTPNVRPFAQVEVAFINDGTLTPFTLGSARLGQASATLYTVAPESDSVFRGLVERITPKWWTRQGGVVTIECVDLFRYLQFSEITALVCAQEAAGARISRVLTHIANPFPVSIDSTGVTMAAATVTANALDYMREVAEEDGGLFYSRGDGKITFVSRATQRASTTYHNVQLAIGDSGAEVKYMDLQQSMDEQQLINRVTAKLSDGTSITAQEDATSQSRYLKRIKDFGTTRYVTLAELEQRALIELITRKRPRFKVDNLEFDMLDTTVNSTALAELGINHRVSLIRRPDQGSSISGEYLVQGYEHDITASPKRWRMRLIVSSAPSAKFILGEAMLSDTAVL